MSHWLGEVWIQIRDVSFVLPLSLFHLENRVCLSRGVQVAGAAWWAARRIVAGLGDLMQRIGDGRTGRVLGGRTIGRSGDTVCSLHRTRGYEEREFLGWASKLRSMICQWFGLKITGTVCQWFGLKTFGMVCQWFDLKITGIIFSNLTSKPVATVFSGLTTKPVVPISPGLTSKSMMDFLVEPQD
jgi:hypothetical protein